MRRSWWSPRMVISWAGSVSVGREGVRGAGDDPRPRRSASEGRRGWRRAGRQAWRSRGAADRVAEDVFDQPIDKAQVPVVGGVMQDDASAPVFTAVRL